MTVNEPVEFRITGNTKEFDVAMTNTILRIREMGPAAYAAAAQITPMSDALKKTADEGIGHSRRLVVALSNTLAPALELVGVASGSMASQMANAAVTMLYFGGIAGIIIGVLAVARAAFEEAGKNTKAFTDEIKKMTEPSAAAKGLAELAEVTLEQAELALKAARDNKEYADRLAELADQSQKTTGPLQEFWGEILKLMGQVLDAAKRLAATIMGVGGFVAAFVFGLTQGADVGKAFSDAIDLAKTEAQMLYDAMNGVTNKTDAQTAAQKKLNALVKDAPKYTKEYSDALSAQADAMKKLGDAQNNILKGIVEKVLTPTSVTAVDMAAAAVGKYKDKWDELRREGEDITINNVSLEKYPRLAAALKETGLSVDDFTNKFKSMSLFADPKNLKFADIGSVAADFAEQLRGLVGKANLMKEGLRQAWDEIKRDPALKNALRMLGIESMGDAAKALAGPAQALTAPFKDKTQVQQYQDAGAQVLQDLKTGALSKESLIKWRDTATVLTNEFLAVLSSKESVALIVASGEQIIGGLAAGVSSGSQKLINAIVRAVQEAMDAGIEAAGGAPTKDKNKPKSLADSDLETVRARRVVSPRQVAAFE